MIRSRSQYIEMDERLLDMFRKSRSLYDCALFIQRQRYFKTKDSGKIKTYNYNALWSIVKNTTQYKNCGLDIGPRTMAIQQVAKAWKSFIKATMEYKKNPEKFLAKPKMPGYKYRHTEFNIIEIDKSRFRGINEENHSIRIPCSDIVLYVPQDIKLTSVRQIRLFVEYDKINVEYVYEDLRYIDNEVIKGSALGIDIGLNNLCAITSNCEELSYIVNGRPLKSINQFWNKKVKELRQLLKTSYSKDVRIDGDDTPSKEKREFTQKKFKKNFKPKKTSKMIQSVCRNRNNRIETYLHQVALKIVKIAVERKY